MASPADMLLFAAVVREGSFTRAAKLVGITKQSTSERIAKLEESLGVRLLERTTRTLRVTEAGAVYFKRCDAIATQVDEANLEVQQRQAEPVGLLRVSAPVLYGRRYLAPVVTRFLQRHPKTSVDLMLADRRVHLIEESVDLAIRIGPLDDSTLTARKLGDGHVYYVASPAFLAKHVVKTARGLRAAPCIGTRASETWELQGETFKIKPVLLVNDLEVACETAVAGVGVALVPSIVCRKAVASGRLRVLFGPSPAKRSDVHVVFPSRQFLPAKVRVFLDGLTTLIEPMYPLAPNPKRAPKRL